MRQSGKPTVVRTPLMVNTTALVIVVPGLYGRDVEFKNPNEGDGEEVTGGPSGGVEEGAESVELLLWELVEDGGVAGGVWGEGSGVEGGIVGVGSSVLVLGG